MSSRLWPNNLSTEAKIFWLVEIELGWLLLSAQKKIHYGWVSFIRRSGKDSTSYFIFPEMFYVIYIYVHIWVVGFDIDWLFMELRWNRVIQTIILKCIKLTWSRSMRFSFLKWSDVFLKMSIWWDRASFLEGSYRAGK